MDNNFANDVLQGLSSNPKWLLSKYFYDEKGSRLFRDIMDMPEYYLTSCEKEIIDNHAEEIAAHSAVENLRVIDLGAGDGLKTELLLKAFEKQGTNVIYSPIDISEEALKQVESRMKKSLPGLKMQSFYGEYFEVLEKLAADDTRIPSLLLFLGSNIGNFSYRDAHSFLMRLNRLLHKGDKMLMGVDLKKPPLIILPAYSDKAGITAAFNINLLERINRELGADFKTGKFKHYSSYEPETGEVRSYLISQAVQQVYVEKLNKSFHFDKWENIHTEISKKYSREELKLLIQESGFQRIESYFDSNDYFTDVLVQKD